MKLSWILHCYLHSVWILAKCSVPEKLCVCLFVFIQYIHRNSVINLFWLFSVVLGESSLKNQGSMIVISFWEKLFCPISNRKGSRCPQNKICYVPWKYLLLTFSWNYPEWDFRMVYYVVKIFLIVIAKIPSTKQVKLQNLLNSNIFWVLIILIRMDHFDFYQRDKLARSEAIESES